MQTPASGVETGTGLAFFRWAREVRRESVWSIPLCVRIARIACQPQWLADYNVPPLTLETHGRKVAPPGVARQ